MPNEALDRSLAFAQQNLDQLRYLLRDLLPAPEKMGVAVDHAAWMPRAWWPATHLTEHQRTLWGTALQTANDMPRTGWVRLDSHVVLALDAELKRLASAPPPAPAHSSSVRFLVDELYRKLNSYGIAMARGDALNSAGLVDKFHGLVAELIAAAAREPRERLTDQQIDMVADQIVLGMPDGLQGFLKTWGWVQFARALLEATGDRAEPTTPQGAQPDWLDSVQFYELMQVYRHHKVDAAIPFEKVKQYIAQQIAPPQPGNLA